MATKDPEKLKATQKRYREKNREKRNEQKRAHYQANKERIRQEQSEYRKANPHTVNASNAAWRARFWPALRAECLKVYGGKCVCCGEEEPLFLELDHIFNDGASERRKHKNGQQEILALKRAGWPKERHQILCANCSRGKLRNGGICPHKSK
jgi:hypothetical protein